MRIRSRVGGAVTEPAKPMSNPRAAVFHDESPPRRPSFDESAGFCDLAGDAKSEEQRFLMPLLMAAMNAQRDFMAAHAASSPSESASSVSHFQSEAELQVSSARIHPPPQQQQQQQQRRRWRDLLLRSQQRDSMQLGWGEDWSGEKEDEEEEEEEEEEHGPETLRGFQNLKRRRRRRQQHQHKRQNSGGNKENYNELGMEGEWRCKRRNGRGWRCSERTLMGYSLCEYHLHRSARFRSVNNNDANKPRNKKKKNKKKKSLKDIEGFENE